MHHVGKNEGIEVLACVIDGNDIVEWQTVTEQAPTFLGAAYLMNMLRVLCYVIQYKTNLENQQIL